MNARFRDMLVSITVAVVLGLSVSASLLLFLGKNPLSAYALLAGSVIRDGYTFADIFVKATPLILTGLAFAFTYKANLFNIGAQGQFYVGAIVATATSLALGSKLPGPLSLVIVFAAAVVAGGLWGSFVGFVKARFGSNEFLVSMMSTYVALAAMNYLLRTALMETKHEYPQTNPFDHSLWLPIFLKGTRLHAGFILAVLIAVLIWLLLFRTALGYRIRVVGHNSDAARLAGIDSGRISVTTFFIAGALAAVAGFTETNGVQHMLVQGFNPNIGAEGIGIAILANANPVGIIFASILIGALKVGGTIMGQTSGVPASIIEIMEGFVMIFVILSYFIRSGLETRRAKRELRRAQPA
ncbi:MAG TPA: ABC transporter permease [Spirochaetia bacterium]|nr:ABC transporter permease [Spirochaetia bacterium]